MYHVPKKLAQNKRRGVSNIIGSLIVLAVVASVGSVILFQGLSQISAFDQELNLHDKEHSAALREKILFEHVRFDPDSQELTLYLANIGSIDTTISQVTVVKIDTQELIIRERPAAVNATILIEDHQEITLNPVLTTGVWNSSYYNSSDYRIVVSTSKGNFEDKIVRPYNN